MAADKGSRPACLGQLLGLSLHFLFFTMGIVTVPASLTLC